MIPGSGRLSPSGRMWLFCRCGGHINLPSFAQAFQVCRCGRRYAYDLELLTVVRPEGSRES